MRRFFPLIIILTGGTLLAGCTKKEASEARPAPPVRVVAIEARPETVTERLRLVGDIAANESVEIKSETEGILHEILFREGEQVEAGQVLARLDDRKLSASVAEAQANFELSKLTFDRSNQLFRDKLISQQEFDQAAGTFALNEATLELRRQQLTDARIHAPFAGVIGRRIVSPGQLVAKNTTLTWLVDLDPVKAEFNVPERSLRQVQLGQTIEVTVDAYPGRVFQGDVFFIAPNVDLATRSVVVKAELPNPDHALKPGMFANLNLTVTRRENAIVIPEAALNQLLAGDRANIFVIGPDDTAEPRQVALGLRLAGRVEITSGLAAGEKVIVEGLQKIGPGSRVTPAPEERSAPYLTRQEL